MGSNRRPCRRARMQHGPMLSCLLSCSICPITYAYALYGALCARYGCLSFSARIDYLRIDVSPTVIPLRVRSKLSAIRKHSSASTFVYHTLFTSLIPYTRINRYIKIANTQYKQCLPISHQAFYRPNSYLMSLLDAYELLMTPIL